VEAKGLFIVDRDVRRLSAVSVIEQPRSILGFCSQNIRNAPFSNMLEVVVVRATSSSALGKMIKLVLVVRKLRLSQYRKMGFVARLIGSPSS